MIFRNFFCLCFGLVFSLGFEAFVGCDFQRLLLCVKIANKLSRIEWWGEKKLVLNKSIKISFLSKKSQWRTQYF